MGVESTGDKLGIVPVVVIIRVDVVDLDLVVEDGLMIAIVGR